MSNNVDVYFARDKAPVAAILDSVTIMHVGSTARDEGLLMEARKRYVFAITSLRLDTARSKPNMSISGSLMVAMCIMLDQVVFSINSIWTTERLHFSPSPLEQHERRDTVLTFPLSSRCIPRLRKGWINLHGSVR